MRKEPGYVFLKEAHSCQYSSRAVRGRVHQLQEGLRPALRIQCGHKGRSNCRAANTWRQLGARRPRASCNPVGIQEFRSAAEPQQYLPLQRIQPGPVGARLDHCYVHCSRGCYACIDHPGTLGRASDCTRCPAHAHTTDACSCDQGKTRSCGPPHSRCCKRGSLARAALRRGRSRPAQTCRWRPGRGLSRAGGRAPG